MSGMIAVLTKIHSLERATTTKPKRFKSFVDAGVVKVEKLYSGPLALHDGSYKLSLTDTGKKILGLEREGER